ADVGYADAVVRADAAARRRRLLLAVNGGLQTAGSAHGRCCPRSGADEIASRLPNVRGNIQLLVHIRIPHCNEWHSVDASGSLAIQRPPDGDPRQPAKHANERESGLIMSKSELRLSAKIIFRTK